MILQGDCIERLRAMPADSFDSLVTDPPAGIGFMGKDWDGDKGGREHWIAWAAEVFRECLRVMKPGAHGLVWALPRTSHWTATALELAGFEVRDRVSHLFGTGFPKSLDVSKAIDKAAGAEREKGALKFRGGTQLGGMNDDGWKPKDVHESAPATDDAKRWAGFGTALKPACEDWWLVRKPLSEKTVAANVLRWGTGALNINASRIEGGARPLIEMNRREMGGNTYQGAADGSTTGSRYAGTTTTGRFPSHLVLSHSPECREMGASAWECAEGCAVAALDAQSGHSVSTGKTVRGGGGRHGCFSPIAAQGEMPAPKDSGGASRFFYCPKASRSDRGDGNSHPTVKSTALMAYLCRLVTPPGGRILDPFAGSGSTGVAALREGFEFTGIEQSPVYAEIARSRIEEACP